jgi:hemolysin-activating ACP:hemolysin acyltransferase
MEHNKANLTPLSILKYLSTEVTMAEGDWNLGTKIWLIKSHKQSLGDL